MLEKYVDGFDSKNFLRTYMEDKNIQKQDEAIKQLRTKIPKETYYQTKIKAEIKKVHPDAFVTKITLGNYSDGGIPDILCVWRGHYFGFEVKRPFFGKTSVLQERTISRIRAAGGTAEVISWPEEAMKVMEDWERNDGGKTTG